MNGWNSYPETTPPADEGPTWYRVRYQDGIEGDSCWWFNHWYCDPFWLEIVAWRPKDNGQR